MVQSNDHGVIPLLELVGCRRGRLWGARRRRHPPEYLPHFFERFYRVDQARDRASGGAGLGLAFVRELVEAMGGGVSVESIPGRGSHFTFRLPVIREAIPVQSIYPGPTG